MMWTLCISFVLFCSLLSRAGRVEGPYLHHAVIGSPLQKERGSYLGFAFGFMAVTVRCSMASGLSASH